MSTELSRKECGLSMSIRVGLIGCGRVAPRHAQSLQQISNTTLVAVADPKIERANNFAQEYGVTAYGDHRILLEDPNIDAVTICVPSGLHAQVTLDALAAGKHVLVEKPIALNLDDADRMIAMAKEKNLRLVLLCIK